MSLLSNMLSRFVIAFLPKSMCDSESGKVSSLVLSNLFQSHGLQSVRLLYPWDSLGKNTGMISHSLLQGIFLTQGSNPGLLHYRQILYHLSHQGSYDKPRHCIKKQRYHFANKGPYSQNNGFSSSHVWMCRLDHKEGWRPKNKCFQTVILE